MHVQQAGTLLKTVPLNAYSAEAAMPVLMQPPLRDGATPGCTNLQVMLQSVWLVSWAGISGRPPAPPAVCANLVNSKRPQMPRRATAALSAILPIGLRRPNASLAPSDTSAPSRQMLRLRVWKALCRTCAHRLSARHASPGSTNLLLGCQHASLVSPASSKKLPSRASASRVKRDGMRLRTRRGRAICAGLGTLAPTRRSRHNPARPVFSKTCTTPQVAWNAMLGPSKTHSTQRCACHAIRAVSSRCARPRPVSRAVLDYSRTFRSPRTA